MTLDEARKVAQICSVDDSYYLPAIIRLLTAAFPEFVWEQQLEDDKGLYNPHICVRLTQPASSRPA